jgi:hypothetical protein
VARPFPLDPDRKASEPRDGEVGREIRIDRQVYQDPLS